jgi:hypothetical protein
MKAENVIDAQRRTCKISRNDPHQKTKQPPTCMANEATKKDLADLEKRILKIITDEVVQINKGFAQETADLNKAIESINKSFAQETANLNKTIEQINKGFADLASRISALEK